MTEQQQQTEKKLTYNDFAAIFKKIKEEDELKITELGVEKMNILLKFSAFYDEFLNDDAEYASILTDAYFSCGNCLSKKFKEIYKTKSEAKLIDFLGKFPKEVLIGEIQYGASHLEPCIRIINTINEYVYEQMIEFLNLLYGVSYDEGPK